MSDVCMLAMITVAMLLISSPIWLPFLFEAYRERQKTLRAKYNGDESSQ